MFWLRIQSRDHGSPKYASVTAALGIQSVKSFPFLCVCVCYVNICFVSAGADGGREQQPHRRLHQLVLQSVFFELLIHDESHVVLFSLAITCFHFSVNS